jgi:hypothetical protein
LQNIICYLLNRLVSKIIFLNPNQSTIMYKSLSILVIALAVMIGCDETSPISQEQTRAQLAPGEDKPTSKTGGCTATTGSPKYAKTGGYNCHQYVRAALVNNKVDLSTGQPQAIDFSNLASTTIQTDANFIRVCEQANADAIAHIDGDHSALRINGRYYYSYPGGTHIWESISALNYGTACDFEYYAAIPDVTITGPVITNGNYKFTLANRGLHSYILSDASRWTYPTTRFTKVSQTDTELIIKPLSGVWGNQTVSATINTSATQSTSSCAKGGQGILTATRNVPVRNHSFYVSPDCGGTIDPNTLTATSLNTVNSVKAGTHKVVMNSSNFTWVRTGGMASYTTTNSGKEMTFTLSSGSVTFNVYGSGCNLNVTFYAN